jgi:hypothetical protein
MKKTLLAALALAFASAAHAGPYDQGYDDGAYDAAAHQQTMAWIDQQGRDEAAERQRFQAQRERPAVDDYQPLNVSRSGE